MRPIIRPRHVLVLISSLCGLAAFAQKQDPTLAEQYEKLRAATSLDAPGATPFHLRVDAEIKDMKGKPAGTGVIEEWWRSAQEYRIEITGGSFHEVIASGQPAPPDAGTRTGVLLENLLETTVHPVGSDSADRVIGANEQEIGQANLSCLLLGDKSASSNHIPLSLCREPGTEDLRVERQQFETIVRNSTGDFHGTHAALGVTIAYQGRDAITGKVTTLQALTPDAPGTPQLVIADPGTENGRIFGHAIECDSDSFRTIHMVDPVYPLEARRKGSSGGVVLRATVTPEGNVRSAVVLSSFDDLLSEASLAALRSWKYSPCTVHGKPVSDGTTIAMDFRIK